MSELFVLNIFSRFHKFGDNVTSYQDMTCVTQFFRTKSKPYEIMHLTH
jgi:hypothetical protein